MITAKEILSKSERKYFEVLQFTLKGENCFPVKIRSNKSLSKDFAIMNQEIAEVFSASKDRKGYGYSVFSETVRHRQHGIQDIPTEIAFESLDDFLKFLNKEEEFSSLKDNYHYIKNELPQLNQWLIENPKEIISNSTIWSDLVKVCQWFIHHFEANKYYIRELPISVHTKFIENNAKTLRLLLEQLVPETVIQGENGFAQRFQLKYDQDIIRFGSLDKSCWNSGDYNDISVPIEQFRSQRLKCNRIFIIENKMNYLTFPDIPNSIAVWGRGFAIGSLKNIDWLDEMGLYYWSDLDAQGFQMVSQIRKYYGQVKSFLMDRSVLEEFSQYITVGTITKVEKLQFLNENELNTFHHLKKNNLRLEQERIPQSYINNHIRFSFL